MIHTLPQIITYFLTLAFVAVAVVLLILAYALDHVRHKKPRPNPMGPKWRWWALTFWAVYVYLVFNLPR